MCAKFACIAMNVCLRAVMYWQPLRENPEITHLNKKRPKLCHHQAPSRTRAWMGEAIEEQNACFRIVIMVWSTVTQNEEVPIQQPFTLIQGASYIGKKDQMIWCMDRNLKKIPSTSVNRMGLRITVSHSSSCWELLLKLKEPSTTASVSRSNV